MYLYLNTYYNKFPIKKMFTRKKSTTSIQKVYRYLTYMHKKTIQISNLYKNYKKVFNEF